MDRVELHNLLKTIVNNVYYQPPASVKMVYPCIRYSRVPGFERHADNSKYIDRNSYDMVYITRTPDDNAVECLRNIKYCKFNRMYTSDNLYHYTFKIFI